MAGIYIHIPFCKTKCIYCDFYSVTDLSGLSPFTKRLLEELRERRDELPEGERIETVYLGGGTPSLLDTRDLAAILETVRDTYPFAPGEPEITIECNPGDVPALKARELVSLGINRVSIGAQSFNPRALRFLTRRHSPDDTREMAARFREAGISNLTLDLIYGIPGTTLEELREDLRELTALRPEHISAYSLMYEEGTPLYRGLLAHKVTEVDEDTALEMSRLVRNYLRDEGYERYEISNYKRSDTSRDFRSVHNSSYWEGKPYLGFGPGAHSYVHPVRSWHVPSLALYLAGTPRESETVTPEMAYEEYLLTRLRTARGIELSQIKALLPSREEYEAFEERALKMTEGEDPLLVRAEGGFLRLTDRGIDLSDAVLRNLV